MANALLSCAFGWISLACWIVVYSPQLWENYTLQSGQGLSVLFVLIWLAGDVLSLIGGLIAHLVPTAIILAIYYVLCDTLLLFQIYYYRWKNAHADEAIAQEIDPSEDTPLLESPVKPTKRWIPENEVLKNSLYFVFVSVAGTLACAIDLTIRGRKIPNEPEGILEWRSQILGWASAIMFLGARIPQILKNLETRCEGLSPALFLFTITGNCTFALSICFASTKRKYLLANAPWLAGSLLTVFLDLFVIAQFVYYRSGKQRRIQL
ncbi:PQ loop repeat-domain-containing protein [Thelephora terrestris]|uniref:PQ loop repeat-domain-containing protein n=1 Tax=Thelephora terrestris TaxID=56493 RepID=A0A9P6L5G4_9AGAM|nr:PQ loop repeat-domain-containing protein [Thelephora terrestris]